MWNEEKQRRLDELRRHGDEQSLSLDEQQELEALFQELDAAEWRALRPALDRSEARTASLTAEIARIRAQSAALEELAGRYEKLLADARTQLDVLSREYEALHREYERIGSPSDRTPVGSA